MLRWVNRGLAGVILLYVLYGTYYFFAQGGMIFPAQDAHIPDGLATQYPNRYEFWLPTDDGPVEAWYLPPTYLDPPRTPSSGADDTDSAPGIHTGDDPTAAQATGSESDGDQTPDDPRYEYRGHESDVGDELTRDNPRSEDRGQDPTTGLDPATDSNPTSGSDLTTDLRAVPVPAWALADSLPAWAPAALMVVAHGNADVIDDWLPRVELVRSAGVGVLLVEYPGYGRSPGEPTQDGITALHLAALDSVFSRGWVDANRLVYTGHSLGGGVACQVAQYLPPQALILISTFTSIRPFAADYFLPGFLVRYPFDNLAVLADYDGEVLVVHAEDDVKVPYEHGKALYEAAAGGWFASRDRGGHDTLEGAWSIFWSTTGLPFLADTWAVSAASSMP